MIIAKSRTFICFSKFLLYEILKILFINDLQKFEGVQILLLQKRKIYLAKRIPIYKFMQKLLCQHVPNMYSTWQTVSSLSLRLSSHTGTLVSELTARPMMASTYFDSRWLGMKAYKDGCFVATIVPVLNNSVSQNKIELPNMGDRHGRI